jgi:hypothetical protein
MVILYPAPGALPDEDPSDDQRVLSYGGPVFWDRRIEDVTFEPSSAGPDLWDIVIEGTVFHDGLLSFLNSGEAADLGMVLDVEVNGTPFFSVPLDFAPVPLVPSCVCGNSCAIWNGSTHTCEPYAAGTCACGWPWLDTVPAVPLTVGDEIVVILRPAPGALPELPGLGGDDEMSLNCCPGATSVEAVADVRSATLEPSRPNPFRNRTTIAFTIERPTPVTLEIFDLQGRRVRTLIDGEMIESSGRQTLEWDGLGDSGATAPAGVYFCRLIADGRKSLQKITYAK